MKPPARETGASNEKMVIIRLFNTFDEEIRDVLTCSLPIKSVSFLNMNEEVIKPSSSKYENGKIRLNVAPKKVITLGVVFEDNTQTIMPLTRIKNVKK